MTLRDAPNLGFRIEKLTTDTGDRTINLGEWVWRDDQASRAATPEEVALWGALQRAETVAEAAEEARAYLHDDCGFLGPWGTHPGHRVLSLLCEALAVWREGKNG